MNELFGKHPVLLTAHIPWCLYCIGGKVWSNICPCCAQLVTWTSAKMKLQPDNYNFNCIFLHHQSLSCRKKWWYKRGKHVLTPKQISKVQYVLVSVYSSVHRTVAGDGSDGNFGDAETVSRRTLEYCFDKHVAQCSMTAQRLSHAHTRMKTWREVGKQIFVYVYSGATFLAWSTVRLFLQDEGGCFNGWNDHNVYISQHGISNLYTKWEYRVCFFYFSFFF